MSTGSESLLGASAPVDDAPAADEEPSWEETPRLLRHWLGCTTTMCAAVGLVHCANHYMQSLEPDAHTIAQQAAVAIALALLTVGNVVRGPHDGILSALLPIARPRMKIGGWVKPGYEQVERAFREHFAIGLEGGAQCCFYVKGEVAVDLWGVREGALPDDVTYNAK